MKKVYYVPLRTSQIWSIHTNTTNVFCDFAAYYPAHRRTRNTGTFGKYRVYRRYVCIYISTLINRKIRLLRLCVWTRSEMYGAVRNAVRSNEASEQGTYGGRLDPAGWKRMVRGEVRLEDVIDWDQMRM